MRRERHMFFDLLDNALLISQTCFDKWRMPFITTSSRQCHQNTDKAPTIERQPPFLRKGVYWQGWFLKKLLKKTFKPNKTIEPILETSEKLYSFAVCSRIQNTLWLWLILYSINIKKQERYGEGVYIHNFQRKNLYETMTRINININTELYLQMHLM